MRRSYPEYKSSRVHWLGDVPKHWAVEKFAYHFVSGMGETILATELSEEGIPVYSATQEDKWFGYVEKANLLLDPGDIVIPARGNSIGHVKLVKQKSTTTQTTIYSKAIHKDRNEPRFIKYFLEGNRKTLFEFDQTAIPQITVSQVSKNRIAIPPRSEQVIIANYLDQETSRIDSLIAKKNEFIERLKEKRTALISQVVTKGLPPDEAKKYGLPVNPKMKPSGVEWLGEIPESWSIQHLKHISGVDPEKLPETTEPDFELLYVDIGNVNFVEGVKDKLQLTFENAPSRARKIVRDGDTIVSTVRTYLKAIAYISAPEENLIVSTGFAVIRPKTVDPKFLSYVLRSAYFVESVVAISNGVSYPATNATDIRNIKLAIASSLAEQEKIARFLDDATRKIDKTIERTIIAVERLAEYRSALITSAVTGKIDVREVIQ